MHGCFKERKKWNQRSIQCSLEAREKSSWVVTWQQLFALAGREHLFKAWSYMQTFLPFITCTTTDVCQSKTITAFSMITKLFILLKFWKIHI